ncbi:hypothetical protein FOMPIDRAFT_1049510 [Fomitopsis schrenkii]|uniref:Uncharacterized protein n=1 Tax=Fomitopsis schrenkii TaxID=2126942 RepID=S8E6X0_FOMSC|nr:hypothetical protein FOMPIDRAFT_1049510 [Fomitopsis schrenkii]
MSLASQAIIIPYTALLVILSQYFALRSLVFGKHTLTSVQDVASSWTGLGPALVNLWGQKSSPSYTFGIVEVTLYLACISALHITTPSLLSQQPFDQDAIVPATAGFPLFNSSSPRALRAQGSLFSYAYALNEIIATTPYLSYIGLSDSTIYDVVEQANDLAEVTVNTTSPNVTCGCLPNATIVETADGRLLVNASYGSYHFEFLANSLAPSPNANPAVMEGMVAGLEWVTALNYNPFFNSSFRAEQFTAPDLSSNVVPVSLPLRTGSECVVLNFTAGNH